ncbi:MAG: hypothetical protein KGI33_07300 [Thaumarchaeota archaeon]|nr:hypothetical protein [Nitrososphaerota archaeon]
MDSASLVIALVAVAISLVALTMVIVINSGLENTLISLNDKIDSLQQGLDHRFWVHVHPSVTHPPMRLPVSPSSCSRQALPPGTGIAVPQTSQAVPRNGLVAEWDLGNVIPDTSGKGNNGMDCGGAFVHTPAGWGLDFNGNGSYVAVPDSPSLALHYGNTIDLWVKVGAYSTHYGMLLDKWVNGQEDKQLGVDSAGHVRYYLFNAFSSTPLVSSTVLLPDRWYNIAGTYDNVTARIYVNGVLDSSKPASGAVGNSYGTLFLGYNPDRAMYEHWFSPFDGTLGGVRIYDRALSGQEVEQLYASAPAGGASLGRYPWGEAYDSKRGEIFVANYDSNTVSVISDRNNTVVDTIPVGLEPYHAVYDPARGEVFVANLGSNTVSVISDRNNTVVDTIPVGGADRGTVRLQAETGFGGAGYIPGTVQPQGMAYDPATGEVFVGEYRLDQVQAISDANNTIVASIGVGDEPQDMAYDSAKREVFVADYGPYPVGSYAGPFHVSVISDENHTVVGTITVGTSPFGVAYDPKMGEIFVTNAGSNTVSVINDTTGKVAATMQLGDPLSAAYDSATGEVFVTSASHGTVSVISDSSNTVTSTIHVGGAPLGIAYDSATGEVFVTDSESNTVSVISDSNDAVVATIR